MCKEIGGDGSSCSVLLYGILIRTFLIMQILAGDLEIGLWGFCLQRSQDVQSLLRDSIHLYGEALHNSSGAGRVHFLLTFYCFHENECACCLLCCVICVYAMCSCLLSLIYSFVKCVGGPRYSVALKVSIFVVIELRTNSHVWFNPSLLFIHGLNPPWLSLTATLTIVIFA